jgi:non-specific serine/threonine protein kinase
MNEEGLTLAREAGDPLRTAMLLHMRGVVADDQDDPEQARARYEDAVPLFRALRPTLPYSSHMLAMALAGLGSVLTEQGDFDNAISQLEEARDIWRARGDRWGIAIALLGLGKTARVRGDLTRALTLHQESLALYWEMRDQGGVVNCLERLAWLLGTGRQAESAAHLFGAVEALRQTLDVPLTPKERPDHEQAMATVQSALGEGAFTMALAHGRARPLEDVIAEAMAVEPSAAAGPTYASATPHGLSLRELEVLRLVAAGHTDREIAAALIMSRRTATTHLTHILDKLGLDSRTAAAAYAVRHGLA